MPALLTLGYSFFNELLIGLVSNIGTFRVIITIKDCICLFLGESSAFLPLVKLDNESFDGSFIACGERCALNILYGIMSRYTILTLEDAFPF